MFYVDYALSTLRIEKHHFFESNIAHYIITSPILHFSFRTIVVVFSKKIFWFVIVHMIDYQYDKHVSFNAYNMPVIVLVNYALMLIDGHLIETTLIEKEFIYWE